MALSGVFDMGSVGASRLRSTTRRVVEHFPTLAQTLRTARESWRLGRRKPQPTPFGFEMVGRADMASGAFEPEETAVIAALLDHCDAFIDVGANVGLYSCLSASRRVKTIAIEPLAENVAYLLRNLQSTGYADVEVFPLAVGERPGIVDLFGGDTGASRIRGWAGSSAKHVRPVAISTLDLLIGDRFQGQRVVIKVDVEGAEAGVLAGASKLLAHVPAPTWIVEVSLKEHHPSGSNRDFAGVFERFWSSGYVAAIADQSRRVVHRDDIHRWVESGKQDFGGHNFLFMSNAKA